jgi:hypothetical protein
MFCLGWATIVDARLPGSQMDVCSRLEHSGCANLRTTPGISAVSELVTIRLQKGEALQLLDGLRIRAESWERTAEYLRLGYFPDGKLFIIEECSDAEEADAIAEGYRTIVLKIEQQLSKSSRGRR